MKKIVMIILTAGLLFGAAACQSKEDKTTPTPEATSSMPEATPADKPETTEPTMAPEAKQGEKKPSPENQRYQKCHVYSG